MKLKGGGRGVGGVGDRNAQYNPVRKYAKLCLLNILVNFRVDFKHHDFYYEADPGGVDPVPVPVLTLSRQNRIRILPSRKYRTWIRPSKETFFLSI